MIRPVIQPDRSLARYVTTGATLSGDRWSAEALAGEPARRRSAGTEAVIRVAAPGGAHPGAGPDPPEGYNLTDEDASVRGLTFRRGWVDVELRVRYGEESFGVEGFGRGRRLLAEAMRSSGRRYAAEQLGGSVVVLQCGRPTGALRWKVRLELDTPDGRHGRQFAAALSFSDLDGAGARLGRATPAGGERAVGLLGFSPVGPARKPVAVELVYRPIDVTAVGAEGGREPK